jgi:hypothetical protein
MIMLCNKVDNHGFKSVAGAMNIWLTKKRINKEKIPKRALALFSSNTMNIF